MLGARIAALRRSRGLSQQQLAARLNVSASAVGMYEQGRREPSARQLVQLAQLFGVTTDYLLSGHMAQPCDTQALRQIVCRAREQLDQTLLLRGADGALRSVTDDELAVLLAALLS